MYEGDMFKDLPLTLQFIKSMSPQQDTAKEVKTEKEAKVEKKEKSIKGVECTFHKTKMYICYEFYRPISKLIHPPKNDESEINK